jgi:hypothetical protein
VGVTAVNSEQWPVVSFPGLKIATWGTRQKAPCMPRFALICTFAAALLAESSVMYSQDVDLCALGRNPSQFSGKMITVRGTTLHGLENHGVSNDRCIIPLDLRAPEKAVVRVAFKLKQDDAWQTFVHYDAMSSDVRYGPESGPHYLVTATFHGLLVYKPPRKGSYFITLILIIESVSDVKVEQD